MSINGETSHASERVVGRLHTFMQDHDLGLEELADMLETLPLTLAQWFNGTAIAPACSLIPLSLVSRLPQSRAYRSHSKEEVLRRVQAL